MPAHILIVEDEPAIGTLLEVTLKREGYTTTLVTDVPAAIAHIAKALPDLVLLDWMLPGISGIDYAQRLRADLRTREMPIIMLTARSAETDKVQGLVGGADDYVTKPFSPRELLARIEAVLRRRLPEASSATISIGGLSLNPATHRVETAGRTINLGPTEFRLLHFFMAHAGRIHSRNQLLDRVWGDHVFIDERTVDVHIRRLRLALASVGKDALIKTVRGSGYLFSDTPPLSSL